MLFSKFINHFLPWSSFGAKFSQFSLRKDNFKNNGSLTYRPITINKIRKVYNIHHELQAKNGRRGDRFAAVSRQNDVVNGRPAAPVEGTDGWLTDTGFNVTVVGVRWSTRYEVGAF